MINKERGEVELKLGSTSYAMRPTVTAMVSIEKELGERLIPIANRMHIGDYGMNDAFVICLAGIRASGNDVDEDEFEILVAKYGLKQLTLPILEFIGNCVSGYGTDSGN